MMMIWEGGGIYNMYRYKQRERNGVVLIINLQQERRRLCVLLMDQHLIQIFVALLFLVMMVMLLEIYSRRFRIYFFAQRR